MRHRIVHDYLHVNLDIVWQTAQENIPTLIANLSPVVDKIIAEAKQTREK